MRGREVRTKKRRAKEGEQDEETRSQDKKWRGREVRTEERRAKEGEQDEERREGGEKLGLSKEELKKESRIRKQGGRRIWGGGIESNSS